MREILLRKLRRLNVYEEGGISVFKNLLYISKLFCVPSLNVVVTTDLGFVPFLILCRDIQK